MMGESDPRTLVLIGRTGNGKSATGNSILGKKMFQSNFSLSPITSSCELKTIVREDGQMLNVIDTPGLLYSSVDLETIGEEIASCIKLAIDGIHAFIVVFSVRNLLFEEGKAAISRLRMLFGHQICDYMIVVFTRVDEIEEEGVNFEDMLCCDCPQALKEILCLCGNRWVIFDNRTKDETKKANQVQQLLSLVNMVLEKNGGEPYTNEIFTDLKIWSTELEVQKEEFQVLKDTEVHSKQEMLELMEKMHSEHLKRTNEMIGLMLIEKKLEVEENAEAARNKAKEDIVLLGEELQEAKRREKEAHMKLRLVKHAEAARKKARLRNKLRCMKSKNREKERVKYLMRSLRNVASSCK